ncbi:MAG: phage portal protein [Anaerolineae bacterium]|nr:phage portal protein [Anaerolineae bacterium]
MSRWGKFKNWLARGAIKASGISFVPQWVRHSVFLPTFWALVREGLKANATVQACVFLLARTFPEPELWPWAHDGTEYKPLPNHPLRQLMRRPNPDMGEAELLAYAITYCSLGGNIYLWKQRSAAGKVVALWPLHDGQMEPIAGQNTAEGLVAYYELDAGDGRKVPIDKNDIIHWKWMIDPEYPWRGMGALVAAAADVDTANELRSFVFSLLKNDATPPVVVTLMEGEEVTPATTRRLRAEWKQTLSGENRGTPAFLEAGMTVQRLALTLNEMKFDNLGEGPEIAICQGFGIQPVMAGTLVGLKTSGVQANFEQARKMLAELTLIPLWRSFASEVQQGMADEMGYKDTAVRFDLSQVRALQENEDELWQRAQRAYDGNLITRAEGRLMVGLASTPADEVYKEGLAMVLTPAGQAPAGKSDLKYLTKQARGQSGVMVALMLPREAAEALQLAARQALPGVEVTAVNEMHLTLAYLGDVTDLTISPQSIWPVLSRFVSEWGPMTGVINGVGFFNKVQDDGTVPFYASFDSPRLPEFRQALINALVGAGIAVAGDHGFVPHITLAYVPASVDLADLEIPREPIVFSAVTLAWAGNRVDFPLRGAKAGHNGHHNGHGPVYHVNGRNVVAPLPTLPHLGITAKTVRDRRREIVEARGRVREWVIGRAETAVGRWFDDLAGAVVERVLSMQPAAAGKSANGAHQVKELVAEDWDAILSLLFGQASGELETVLQRHVLEVVELSWSLWNLELESTAVFDINDPAVTNTLLQAGVFIRDMGETTRNELAAYLQEAYRDGRPIEEMARRVRELITETYKNRARAIARTEIGRAQNQAGHERYRSAGVQHVEVFDNGFDNSHEFCRRVAGKTVTLEWSQRNPLQHPNCVRAFGAVFDYTGQVFTEEMPWG